jgi:hypothetical protein
MCLGRPVIPSNRSGTIMNRIGVRVAMTTTLGPQYYSNAKWYGSEQITL